MKPLHAANGAAAVVLLAGMACRFADDAGAIVTSDARVRARMVDHRLSDVAVFTPFAVMAFAVALSRTGIATVMPAANARLI